jgi:hypothetical protein
MSTVWRGLGMLVWMAGIVFLAQGLPWVAVSSGQGATSEQAVKPGEQAVKPGEVETLTLRQRAAEYWQARVARDYKSQWELTEPRLKGRITPEEYARGKGAIQYLGYEVGDASIDGSFATVQVKVIARVALPNSPAKPVVRTATVGDAWVKVDGVWYRRADQPEGGGQGGRPPAPSTLQ